MPDVKPDEVLDAIREYLSANRTDHASAIELLQQLSDRHKWSSSNLAYALAYLLSHDYLSIDGEHIVRISTDSLQIPA